MERKNVAELTNQIKTASSTLMHIVLGEDADETLIRQIQNDTYAAIQYLTEALALSRNWIYVHKKPAEKCFKVQSGVNRGCVAESEDRMLIGCINRMCVSDDCPELVNMADGACYHINALTQLALEKIGVLTIPEFKWSCKLF